MDSPSFANRRKEPRPGSGEAPFDAGEVFYSRTDRRGVIRSGNYIFRRVADFSWEELIGAPHKIIRHPDMPKAAFWLLWEMLLKDRVVGAYVKNRAKDGLYYWVFAIVAPWKDGFLSARFKPTSGLLGQVEALYGQLLRAEGDGLTPEQSAGVLLGELRKLGFETYEDFMSHACSEELMAETRTIGLPPDPRIVMAGRILTLASTLAEETACLVEEFAQLSIVPHNLRLAAARLEPAGGPISTLSRNYGELSQEMSRWFHQNVIGTDSDFANIKRETKNAMFLECAASVLHRCERQLLAERRNLGPTDLDKERGYLNDLAGDYLRRAQEASTSMLREARRIADACMDMERELLALNATRVACNIENARLHDRLDGLEDIIAKFGHSQQAIEKRLATIETSCAGIIDTWESAGDKNPITAAELLYGPKMAVALGARGAGGR